MVLIGQSFTILGLSCCQSRGKEIFLIFHLKTLFYFLLIIKTIDNEIKRIINIIFVCKKN